MGPGFFALAAWFVYGPEALELPSGDPVVVDPREISTTPRRARLDDPPTIVIDGQKRTCMECHRLFEPSAETPSELVVHSHVHLDHGINDRCRNCHHLFDRDKLVLHDGRVIGFSESQLLCAKCHGPTYRDWERGAHGRSNGYWDRSRGDLVRLACSQCHDPHHPRVPAMDPLVPLPGPHLLHGDPGAHGDPAHAHEDSAHAEEAE